MIAEGGPNVQSPTCDVTVEQPTIFLHCVCMFTSEEQRFKISSLLKFTGQYFFCIYRERQAS